MTLTEDIIETREDVLLHAAIDTRKMPSVSILAYAGGIMKVAPWGNIVIDLAGLDVLGSVAILSDHDSSRRGVVGHGEAMVKDGRLVVAGSISAGGQAAREIVDAARNGFPWQASVGVEVLEHRRVAAGETAYVNGNALKAPAGGLTLVAGGRLREVSIVGLGCDTATTVAIAASKNKEQNMDVVVEEKEVKDTELIEASETKRLADINRICGSRHSDIEARAIAEKWDTSRAELEVLRADRPRVPAKIGTVTVPRRGEL